MKALQYQGPGKLAWIELPAPQIHATSDVIIRPLAIATCDLDWEIIAGRTPFPAPFLLGHEFVGEITECGNDVNRFSVGDRVSVAFQPSCGHCAPCTTGESSACRTVPPTSMFGVGQVSGDWGGAFAERIRVPFADNMLTRIPVELPVTWFPSASDNIADAYRAVGGFVTADNQARVLVYGGYHSIPLYATAIALALGAGSVTFCTTDPRAADNAQRLGAQVELDSTWPDRLATHDVTLCAVPDPRVLKAAIRSTLAGGHCTSTAIFAEDAPLPLREMYMRGLHLHTGRVNGAEINAQAVAWIASGLLQPLMIDTQLVNFDGLIPALLQHQCAKLICTP